MTRAAARARLLRAVERTKAWMVKHGAKALVDNLAPGASESQLKKMEAALGFAIPAELRALWSLHNGQKEELNGFVLQYDLFHLSWAKAEREELLERYVREVDDDEADDAKSERWIPFAGRDSEYLAVNADDGRVFWFGKDWPPSEERAESLVQWFERYADGLERGSYKVKAGFGDCYVAPR
jgi:cell wall assembly regulator SMI1